MADIVVVYEQTEPIQVNVPQAVTSVTVTPPTINVVDASGLFQVNITGDGTGGSSTFVGLTDTPSSFTGQASKAVAVNQSANALEFINFPQTVTSVTQLSDVTSAGSGDIITTAERTDIANNKIGVAANASNYELLKGYIITTETDKLTLKQDVNNKIDVDATSGSEKIDFTVNAVNTVTIDDTELNAAKVTVGAVGSQFSLPTTDGTSTQVLKTNGSGAVSFADVSYTDITNKPTIPTLGISKTVTAGAGEYSEGTQTYSSWSTGLTLTAGSVYYWNGSWVAADASAASSATGLIAVCSSTTDGTDMVKNGVVQSSTSLTGLTNGAPLYLSTTTGGVTATAPSASTEIVRVVGYVVDAANNLMEFSPSNDWIEIA